MQFVKATKTQSRLRLAFIGSAGSGKTYSALAVAKGLGGRVAVLDTERGSASKYSGLFEFDTLWLETFAPATYVEAIHAAEHAGYDVLVIDSLSHAWMGKDGALEQVDRAQKISQNKNSFAAWRDVTPQHNALVDAMLQSKCHIIVTLRAKTEYVMEENVKGKMVPRKIGLAPIQRDGLEYEFDVVGTLTENNELIIGKTRCPELAGKLFDKPGADFAHILKNWLTDGTTAQSQPAAPAQKATTAPDAGKSPGRVPSQPATVPPASGAPPLDIVRQAAVFASKKAGADKVREIIKAITGGTLADAKPEQHEAILAELRKAVN